MRDDNTARKVGIVYPAVYPGAFFAPVKLQKCLRHRHNCKKCPTYPQKRIWISTAVMSALCQKAEMDLSADVIIRPLRWQPDRSHGIRQTRRKRRDYADGRALTADAERRLQFQ